jgi:hypothetical protein
MALKKPTKITIWVVLLIFVGLIGFVIWAYIDYYNTEINHDYTNFKDVELETFKIKIPYKWEFEERDGVLFLISSDEQQGEDEVVQFVEGERIDYSTGIYSHGILGSIILIEKYKGIGSSLGASYLFGRFQLDNGETRELYILEINDVYLYSNNCTDKGIIIKIFYSMVSKQ